MPVRAYLRAVLRWSVLITSLLGSAAGLNSRTVADPEDMERAYKARNTLSTLKNVAEWFGGVRGRRKTLLWLSEGIDYDITDLIRDMGQPASQASTIIEDVRDAIAAATRANVSIYAVDPRGLTTMGDDTIGVSALGNFDDPGNGLGLSGLQNELMVSQNSLRTLADETGGFASVNTNQFANAFMRIVEDNSHYYVLAYYPPSNKRDGKFHKIEVRSVKPGLTVRSRKGYQSPRGKAPAAAKEATGKASAELLDALNSPIPVSGVSMRLFAAPFKGATAADTITAIRKACPSTTIEVLTKRTREQVRSHRWRSRVNDHTVIIGYGVKGRASAKSLTDGGISPHDIVVVAASPPLLGAAAAVSLARSRGLPSLVLAYDLVGDLASDAFGRVTRVPAQAVTAVDKAVVFSMRNLPLLEQGTTYDSLATAENLWTSVKVYASGGENALHAHGGEDQEEPGDMQRSRHHQHRPPQDARPMAHPPRPSSHGASGGESHVGAAF